MRGTRPGGQCEGCGNIRDGGMGTWDAATKGKWGWIRLRGGRCGIVDLFIVRLLHFYF